MKGNKKNPTNIVLASVERCMLTLNREMLTATQILDACCVRFCMYAGECGHEIIYVHMYDEGIVA